MLRDRIVDCFIAAQPDLRHEQLMQQYRQAALREDVNWIHQPAFDKAFADLTGTRCENDEWRRETRWNFTADDESFT